MAFYLDFLLDVNNLQSSLAYPVAVAGYEVAVVSLGVPKTFDNTVEYIRLQANFISTQPFYDGRSLLVTTPCSRYARWENIHLRTFKSSVQTRLRWSTDRHTPFIPG